jgi:hypothetical protein
MRKTLSITELLARRSLWKVLAVLAVMAAAELGWFALMLGNRPDASLYDAGKYFAWIFAAANIAVFLVLGGPAAKKTNYSYSVRMLGVTEGRLYLINIVYCLLAFLMVWGVQAAVLMAAAKMYMSAPGFTGVAMSPMVEIYSSRYLHAMLPMQDYAMLAVLAAGLLFLAVYAASFAEAQRARSTAVSAFLGLICVLRSRMLAAEAGLLFAIVAAFFAMFCVFAATGRFAKKGSKEVDDGE